MRNCIRRQQEVQSNPTSWEPWSSLSLRYWSVLSVRLRAPCAHLKIFFSPRGTNWKYHISLGLLVVDPFLSLSRAQRPI